MLNIPWRTLPKLGSFLATNLSIGLMRGWNWLWIGIKLTKPNFSMSAFNYVFSLAREVLWPVESVPNSTGLHLILHRAAFYFEGPPGDDKVFQATATVIA